MTRSEAPDAAGDSPERLALLPLDERPVNTRYPAMVAAIAGAELLLPPEPIRGRGRVPADLDAVAAWLREEGPGCDAAIASLDYLLYGNLINSRISGESAADALPRLRALEELGAAGVPVYAFSLITRVSNADDAVEEPEYWAQYGTRFYRYARLLHRHEAGALDTDEAAEMERLERELPPEMVADWLRRRLRNHTLNLVALDLLARDRLSLLLLTSDDTSEWGLPSREKTWLESWLPLLPSRAQLRTMMHPGADEVGTALVARALVERRGAMPRIWTEYAVPGGEEIVAPYEDRPVRITVEGQIAACGAVAAGSPEDADVILGVLPPSPRRTEFRDEFAGAERDERGPLYAEFLARMAALQQSGKPVALADVAYPNGADPLLMEMLLSPDQPLEPAGLAAFGAWNTAGNTLGVVVAQAVCALSVDRRPERQQAQNAFLAHRFLEDYGYQTLVRRDVRARLAAEFGFREPRDDRELSAACGWAEEGLAAVLEQLQARGVGRGFVLAPGSVRLPWRRTFEVDFALVDAEPADA